MANFELCPLRRCRRLTAKHVALAHVCLVPLMLMSAPGLAQVAPNGALPQDPQASAGAGSMEDIIVTARRREESLQSVPVSVSVATPAILSQQQIVQAQDLQRLAPGLTTVVPTVSQQQSGSFTIRGQGQSFGGALPSVITYFAEVPLDSAGGAAFALYDVSSVQVLRGPQGTLFGRNTNGGAILLTANAPEKEFGGYLDGFVGNLDYVELRGALNVPISDTLSLRIAGNHARRDDYVKNLSGHGFNNIHVDSWRAYLRWEPSDTFRNDTIYNGLSADEHGSAYILFALRPGSNSTRFNNGSLVTDLAAQRARGVRLVSQPTDGLGSNRDIHLIANTSTLKLSDDAQLKGIISYQRVKVGYGTDFDGAPTFFQRTTSLPNTISQAAGIRMYPDTNSRQVTGELQLSGTAVDDRLEYQVGGFVLDNRSLGGLDEFRAYRNGSSAPNATSIQHNFVTNQFTDQSKALFTQNTFRFGRDRQFALTAGFRYTWDERALSVGRIVATVPLGTVPTIAQYSCQIPGVATAVAAARTPAQCFETYRLKHDDYGYNLSADWKVGPGLLLYVASRRGFKDGGINNLNFGAVTSLFYEPEVVTDYETGMKWTYNFGVVRGRLNIDGFTSKYSNVQVQVVTGAPPVSAIVNADGRIKGIEVESFLQIGEFSLSGAYAYLHGRFKPGSFIDSGRDVSASRFVGLPKHSGNITAAWAHELDGDAGTIAASATVYATKGYASIANNVSNFEGIVPGYKLLSGRIEWRDILGKNVDLALWGKNLTDKVYRQGGGSQGGTTGISNGVYGEPRTYGVEAKVRF